MKSSTATAKGIKGKLTEFENENKSVKQIANGYFFKWKKTKEENKRLLSSASSSFQPVDVPKSMLINKDLLTVEMGSILGEGTFGRCVKGKYKGLNVCLKFFHEKSVLRSKIISEVKVMLGLTPHSSLPLLFGVCIEPDPIIITQFIGCDQESITLDNFFRKPHGTSMKCLDNCSPEHIILAMFEGLQAIHLSGFIHNDIKPNNVLIQMKGLHYNAVIIDFGKSCPLHKGTFYKLPNKMEKQNHLNRYPHLAPELVFGDSPQNVFTDIYSLGYTVKKVLNKKFGNSLNYLKDISQSCMSRQPRNRPGLNYFIDFLSRRTSCHV